MYKKKTGALIRHYRKTSGLTQEELAQSAGISVMSIRRYERGERVIPAKVLSALASVLNVSVSTLSGAFEDVDSFFEEGYDFADIKAARDDVIRVAFEAEAAEFIKSVYARDIIHAFQRMNIEGQKAAADRVCELSEIPKYQKEEQ